MAWATVDSTEDDRQRLLGPGVDRVHLIEYSWLRPLLTARLYAYAFDEGDFVPFGTSPHAMVADHPVRPLGPPRPVGDLLRAHAEAGIELRLVRSLWPWWRAVTASSLGFSGIRLRNSVNWAGSG